MCKATGAVGFFFLVLCSFVSIHADNAIDFSYAGFGGGGVEIPVISATLKVDPLGPDDTRNVQAAIDYVSSRAPDANGFRGAILLSPGTFHIKDQLRIRVGGVVIRGSESGTTIIASGNSRRTLFDVRSANAPDLGPPVAVTDGLVSVGKKILKLETVDGFVVGDRIRIERPCTKEWIEHLFSGRKSGWSENSLPLVWFRTIESIDAQLSQVTLDCSLTTAVEDRFGGAVVQKVKNDWPLKQVGIERLRLESEYDIENTKDENHSWFAIALNDVEDAWVRDVTAVHFAGGGYHVLPQARRVSIVDCECLEPISETGGYRRRNYLIEGSQTLVMNCKSEKGICDFALGLGTGGPNVFLNCQANDAVGPSGPYESWASGVLFENVSIDGSGIDFGNSNTKRAGGWLAANSSIVLCAANPIELANPPGAENEVTKAKMQRYSLQLAARNLTIPNSQVYPKEANVESFQATREQKAEHKVERPSRKIEIVNGRYSLNGQVVWGGQLNGGWWKGQVTPATSLKIGGIGLAKFVPGREGPGLTENLPELAERMSSQKIRFYQDIPGLWYDRRRDAHSTFQQPDGNVQPPFLELQWNRSGEGTAWDGLSKFDLTEYNTWYFERVDEFARLADQHGLLLYHHLFNNHDLMEIEPHWVDYPWRPANCINETGLPEPPPVDKDNRLYVGNEFFDPQSDLLRPLHRSFIEHTLDEIADHENVLFSVGFQFVGPLAYQQFFHDVVAEWEAKHGRSVRIALVTTKDITDAILQDPVRSKQVAAVDMRYWQYRPDGTLFAPPGGTNRAFRDMVGYEFQRRGDEVPPTTPTQAYRQVREYRDKYPHLALIAWNNGVGSVPAFMAGAAQVMTFSPASGHNQAADREHTPLDDFITRHLSDVLTSMSPQDVTKTHAKSTESESNAPTEVETWILADESRYHVVAFATAGEAITLPSNFDASQYEGLWFNTESGEEVAMKDATSTSESLAKPDSKAWLLYLKKKG